MLEPILTDHPKDGLSPMKTISALMFQTTFGFTSRRLQASTPNGRQTCRLRIHARLLMSCLLATASTQPVAAELPSLQDQPWLGYYAVYADKNYEFKITAADGIVTLIPVGEGAPVLGNLLVYIKFGIEETLPDGKIVSSPVRADTLEVTLAPNASSCRLASARFRVSRVPVSTRVLPARGWSWGVSCANRSFTI